MRLNGHTYLCLQQFDKLLIRCACNDLKRKSSQSDEPWLEKLVKSLQFLAGFSYLEPLCVAVAAARLAAGSGGLRPVVRWLMVSGAM